MTSEVIIAIIGVISSVVSSFVTHVVTKRKYNVEVDASVIQNLEDSLDLYKKICDDNNQRLEEYKRENQELRDRVNELQNQVMKLMTNICYNSVCRVRELEDKHQQLTSKNGQIRKNNNGNQVKKNSQKV